MIQLIADNFYVLFLLIFCGFIFYRLNLILQKFQIEYSGPQRIHDGSVPRTGGILMYICLLIFTISQHNKLLLILSICFLPLFFLILTEDIKHNISITKRLYGTALFSFACTFILKKIGILNFPIINLLFFHSITSNYFFACFFYTFCAIALINSMNILDGLNGNTAFTSICILLSIIHLSQFGGIEEINHASQILILATLIFLIFNFPFGKLFLGDNGAYFLGFMISFLTIKLFGELKLNPFVAIIVLIYPFTEIVFSFLRKMLIDNISPFKADNYHLHFLVYKILKSRFLNIKVANNMASLTLLPFSFAPLLFILGDYFLSFKLAFIFFACYFFSYISIYVSARLISNVMV